MRSRTTAKEDKRTGRELRARVARAAQGGPQEVVARGADVGGPTVGAFRADRDPRLVASRPGREVLMIAPGLFLGFFVLRRRPNGHWDWLLGGHSTRVLVHGANRVDFRPRRRSLAIA